MVGIKKLPFEDTLLYRIKLMQYVELIRSSECKLIYISICSMRNRSRTLDKFKNFSSIFLKGLNPYAQTLYGHKPKEDFNGFINFVEKLINTTLKQFYTLEDEKNTNVKSGTPQAATPLR